MQSFRDCRAHDPSPLAASPVCRQAAASQLRRSGRKNHKTSRAPSPVKRRALFRTPFGARPARSATAPTAPDSTELQSALDCIAGEARKRSRQKVSKSELKWSEKQEDPDFDAAFKYLSLLCSDRKAHALVKSLRGSKILEHAAKDLLRGAQLPLLPSDELHVSEDLKRIQRARRLRPFFLCAATWQADFLSSSRTVITASARSAISMRARRCAAGSPT
jgi:hypothetical protein